MFTTTVISIMNLFQSPAFFRGLLPLGEDSVVLGLVSLLHTYMAPAMPNSPVQWRSARFDVEIAATSAPPPSSPMLCTPLLLGQSQTHSLLGVVFLGLTCKRWVFLIHFHFLASTFTFLTFHVVFPGLTCKKGVFRIHFHFLASTFTFLTFHVVFLGLPCKRCVFRIHFHFLPSTFTFLTSHVVSR